MLYQKLDEEFVSSFPKDKEYLNSIAKRFKMDDSDGMHVFFGLVVAPFIVELLDKHEKNKLQTAFSFLEKMAVSDDTRICEILEFTILEDFISRGKDFLEKCRPYMGKETLKSCRIIEKNMFS